MKAESKNFGTHEFLKNFRIRKWYAKNGIKQGENLFTNISQKNFENIKADRERGSNPRP